MPPRSSNNSNAASSSFGIRSGGKHVTGKSAVADSVKTSAPVTLVASVASTTPFAPVAPELPVAPAVPVAPELSVAPELPIAPAAPVTTATIPASVAPATFPALGAGQASNLVQAQIPVVNATPLPAVPLPTLAPFIPATETVEHDTEFERFVRFVDNLVNDKTYIASDYVINALYRWSATPKADGFGSVYLDRVRNSDAVFTIIGQVLPDAMDLAVVPGWNGSEHDAKNFRGARYRFSIGPVMSSRILRENFEQGVEFLKDIIHRKSTFNFANSRSLFHSEEESPDDIFGIKFSRRFFANKDFTAGHPSHQDNPYPWVYEDAFNLYSNELASTLVPTPFPAQTLNLLNGAVFPIAPKRVSSTITNAIVAVSFKLKYYRIRDRVIYNGDVVKVSVLN